LAAVQRQICFPAQALLDQTIQLAVLDGNRLKELEVVGAEGLFGYEFARFVLPTV
jgi:hypothetical protein